MLEPHPESITLKEIAETMDKSISFVYQNIAQIPHRKVGNLFIVSRRAFNEWFHNPPVAVPVLGTVSPGVVATDKEEIDRLTGGVRKTPNA